MTATDTTERVCRDCGHTDADYRLHLDHDGLPCWWPEPDLCSRCAHNDLWGEPDD